MRIDLVCSREIQQMLGVSRQRVNQLALQPGWPEPVARLAVGRIWLRADIRAWIALQRPELAARAVDAKPITQDDDLRAASSREGPPGAPGASILTTPGECRLD